MLCDIVDVSRARQFRGKRQKYSNFGRIFASKIHLSLREAIGTLELDGQVTRDVGHEVAARGNPGRLRVEVGPGVGVAEVGGEGLAGA